MKRALVAVAITVVLIPGAAAGSAAHAPKSAAAKAAFGRFLHELYGSRVRGYWSCPAADRDGNRIACRGEVVAGGRRHQVGGMAGREATGIWFSDVWAHTWSRHWSRYSARVLRRGGPVVTGVASVNSPAFDWGFLALCAGELHVGHTRSCDALDGQFGGWLPMYEFACAHPTRNAITCHNRLGDAIRYRPHG